MTDNADLLAAIYLGLTSDEIRAAQTTEQRDHAEQHFGALCRRLYPDQNAAPAAPTTTSGTGPLPPVAQPAATRPTPRRAPPLPEPDDMRWAYPHLRK